MADEEKGVDAVRATAERRSERGHRIARERRRERIVDGEGRSR